MNAIIKVLAQALALTTYMSHPAVAAWEGKT